MSFSLFSLELEIACMSWHVSERIQSLQNERTSLHAKEAGYNNELQQTQQKVVVLEKVGFLCSEESLVGP